MFFVLVLVLFFVDLTAGGQCPPNNDSASTSSRRHGSASSCLPRGFPKKFCRLFSAFSWPSGVFCGVVPLAAFSTPLVSWFWRSGWVVFLPALASSIFLLHLGKPGPRTRNPPPLQPVAFSASCLTRLLLGVVGGTR